MINIKCPSCRSKRLYFDSPTEGINICIEKGRFVLRHQEDGRKLKRTLENKSAMQSQVDDEMWEWTCANCERAIEYGTRAWDRLRKAALEYLR